MKRLVKEKVLLYKIQVNKDPEAFGELYDFYIEPIYRFVFFKLSNREDAEDITSEVFLKAWNYLIETEQKISNFRQLIYTIARNRIIDVYRERAQRLECPIETIDLSGEHLGDKIEQKQEADKLLSLIKKLKSEYQEIVHLRYIEELSINEITKIVDKSNVNVRVIIHRATKKLKELSDNQEKTTK